MSPPIQMATHASVPYNPTSDAMDRHEYGVSKNRKIASSTGGGRAWSEDEEVYLLQTRLQKMPYKHIAAHLKKTELACRLHYHQLSHGSNRRKRTASVSSTSSSTGQSPILPASIPSPIQEYTTAREASSPESTISYGPGSPGRQLPAIMGQPAPDNSRLPAILPKPTGQREPVFSLPGPPPSHPHMVPRSLAPSPFPQSVPMQPSQSAPLRLDCSTAPPRHIDLARLQSVYGAHRAPFWTAIAADYGGGVSPAILEEAWRAHLQPPMVTATTGITNAGAVVPPPPGSSHTPITPVTSPNDRESSCEKTSADKTRISAILGIDANPRSPRERELVRRMEEERGTGGGTPSA